MAVEHTAKKTLFALSAIARLGVWWFCGGLFWLFAGALLFSAEWGLLLALYAYAVGPILGVSLFWLSFRLELWGLVQYRHHRADHVTKWLLQWHLKNRGPRPLLWMYPSAQIKIFLLPDFFNISKRQHLVVSHAFLRLSHHDQFRLLENLWSKMQSLGTRGMRLHAWKLLVWFSVLSPLIVSIEILDRIQALIIGKRIHEIAEWVQPLFFRLQSFLFEAPHNDEIFLGASRHPLNLVIGFWDESLGAQNGTGNSSKRELKQKSHVE